MFLRRFAESTGFAFESFQTQAPESVGILRPEGANLYIHLEASVACDSASHVPVLPGDGRSFDHGRLVPVGPRTSRRRYPG